jgi:hemin uptake protein HemP
MQSPPPSHHAPSSPFAGRDAPAPCHDARSLTEGGTAAQIALDGKTYTLRITRAGKLILTK